MKKFIILLLITFLAGCVTPGPYVSDKEIRQKREELQVKALRYKIENLIRVNDIGHRLVKYLPSGESKGRYPYTGLILMPIDRRISQIFNLSQETGVVVAGIVKDSPAEKAGFSPGDQILKIKGKKIIYLQEVGRILSRLRPGRIVDFQIQRGELKQTISLNIGEEPIDISFAMVDEQEVNAGTTPQVVAVTYGLMRFVKSDDEVAVVLGHELAHIVRGHHLQATGTGFLSTILGIAAGRGMESVSPGSGDMTARVISSAFNAQFSKDFEREADYFGLRYVYLSGYDVEAGARVWERFAIEVPQSLTTNFFSTHPSSPERLLRINKTIEELKAEEN